MTSFEAEIRAPHGKKFESAGFSVVGQPEAEAIRIFSSLLGVPPEHVRLIRIGEQRKRKTT